MCCLGGQRLAETRAYFPNREEAERFARQFDGTRYRIDISPQPRHDRQVFQVHVSDADPAREAGTYELLRIVGAVGDRARSVGLDGDTLARRMGRALGEAVAGKHATPVLGRAAALEELGALLARCGLGSMTLVSHHPLIVRVEPLALAARGPRGCAHVAGFLEGALGHFLGKAVGVREIDCVGAGSDDCTFAVDA